MGLSFSSENKTKKRKEERVPYIDKRRSYKRPKHKMSKTMMNVLASENVVSFSMKNDAMSLALSCENAYENVSQMNSYWYAQSVSVGAGDWNWFFMKDRKKIPGKSWLEVHNFLMKEKARYILNDLKDAFPENLSFGKNETWKKCKLNRDALNFAFSDLVHLFPAFNEEEEIVNVTCIRSVSSVRGVRVRSARISKSINALRCQMYSNKNSLYLL